MLIMSLQAVTQIRKPYNFMKFNLRAWTSNSNLLMKAVQQDGTSDETYPTNVLGIHWATNTDRLSLSLKIMHHTSALTAK